MRQPRRIGPVSDLEESPWSAGPLPYVLYVGDESERRDEVLAHLGEGWGAQAARDGIRRLASGP